MFVHALWVVHGLHTKVALPAALAQRIAHLGEKVARFAAVHDRAVFGEHDAVLCGLGWAKGCRKTEARVAAGGSQDRRHHRCLQGPDLHIPQLAAPGQAL